MDMKQRIEFLSRILDKWLPDIVAGTVDQNIDLPKLGANLYHCVCNLILVSDIGAKGHHDFASALGKF